ncbi:unnamed protein product, partial [Adineta ricciae]
MNGSGGRIYL